MIDVKKFYADDAFEALSAKMAAEYEADDVFLATRVKVIALMLNRAMDEAAAKKLATHLEVFRVRRISEAFDDHRLNEPNILRSL